MMPIRYFVIMLSIVSGITAGSCSAKTPDSKHGSPASKDMTATAAAEPVNTREDVPDKTILFFMNPNGRPCRMQNEILSGMTDSLAGLAKVAYVKTTESGDREKFYTYGIRGLPSLVIVDRKGNEITRFPPGIQSKETILDGLRQQAVK